MKQDEAIIYIANFPKELEKIARGLSKEELSKIHKYPKSEWIIGGKWTIAQVIHHIADAHMNKFFQLRDMLTSDNPKLVEYKTEKIFPSLKDASSVEIESSLMILKGVHERAVKLLKGLNWMEWKKTGLHPKGKTSVEGIAKTFVTHGKIHISQIEEVLSKDN